MNMKTVIYLVGVLLETARASVLIDNEATMEWEAFKAQHGKAYPTEEEEAQRINIFLQNQIKIAEHNSRYAKGQVSFAMKANMFADMLPSELALYIRGPSKESQGAKKSIHKRGTTPLADKLDWRKKGYVTPVKAQGLTCGSCWAFGAIGSLEGQMFKKTGKLVALSEQNLIDCSFEEGNRGCNGGEPRKAFEYILQNGGIDTEISYPYMAKNKTCAYNSAYSAGSISDFVELNSTEDDLLDAVYHVGPVTVGIDAQHSFHLYSHGLYFEENCTYESNHFVVVVGYGRQSDEDFWLVKNSWGTEWGEGGYVKMARNRNNNCGIASEASYPVV